MSFEMSNPQGRALTGPANRPGGIMARMKASILSLGTGLSHKEAGTQDLHGRDQGAAPLEDPVQPGSKILIVEDEEDVCVLLGLFLQHQGYITSSVVEGRQAVRFIDDSSPVDLVILDFMLPYFDGFHVLRHIRSKPGWMGTPVLMLSGISEERHIVRLLNAGANDYMVKPFGLNEVSARVQRLLRVSSD